MNKNSLLLIVVLLFTACAVKPTLNPINVSYIDIEKDVSMNLIFKDFHTTVAVKNRTRFPGHHRDVDENNFLPVPFVEYLRISIIDNLKKSKIISNISNHCCPVNSSILSINYERGCL